MQIYVPEKKYLWVRGFYHFPHIVMLDVWIHCIVILSQDTEN